jgi:ribosome-associated protein
MHTAPAKKPLDDAKVDVSLEQYAEQSAQPHAAAQRSTDASGYVPFYDRPSKTRRKKDSHELQDLGEAAVALPDARLDNLEIAESLLDAIRQYKKTRSHEGRRRQMQFIGKLMRRHDIEPLRAAVNNMQLGRAQDSLALHQAERWRAELIASDNALTRWALEQPESDLQQLRNLIRAARKDATLVPEKRNGRGFRELFQFIKQYEFAVD